MLDMNVVVKLAKRHTAKHQGAHAVVVAQQILLVYNCGRMQYVNK